MLRALGKNDLYLQEPYRLKAGDILGFSSYTWDGVWINLGTWRVPFFGRSHIAILVEVPERSGELVICEATMSCPDSCLVAERLVSGVQFQPIGRRLRKYRGAVWLYPLAEEFGPSSARSTALTRIALELIGKPYDLAGAIRARKAGFGWLERVLIRRPEDLNAYYCAELVLKLLRDVNRVMMLNVSNYSPNTAFSLLRRGVVDRPRRLRIVHSCTLSTPIQGA